MECPFGYSDKYFDMEYEYRHVIIPRDLAKQIPMGRTLTEPEWRSLGIQMSRGWIHYAWYQPEPHILLFRRPLGTDPKTGLVDEEKAESEKKLLLQSLGGEEEEKKSN